MGADAGAAYVFTEGSSGSYKLTDATGHAGDDFGRSVAFSGAYIAVGAPLDLGAADRGA